MLMTLSIILAIANIILQIIDLHTTSEVIKRGAGSEANDVLAVWLNDSNTPWSIRFYRLAFVKLVAATLGALPTLVISWFSNIEKTTNESMLVWILIGLAIQGLLTIFYAVLMKKNWAIYNNIK